MRPQLVWICYLLIVLSYACSANPDEPIHVFIISEKDGIQNAVNNGIPKYQGELFRFEILLTLEENQEKGESYLVRPTSFLNDDRGYYYIADRADARIVVYNASGYYVFSFGQRGAGPGDLDDPVLTEISNGLIDVWDRRLRRTTRYRTDGQVVDVLTSIKATNLDAIYHGPNQSVIEICKPYRRDTDYQIMQARVVIFNSGEDTLGAIESEWVPISYVVTFDGDTPVSRTWVLFASSRPNVIVVPDRGLYLTTGATPSLYFYDFTGREIRRIELNLAPQPVSEDEYNAQVQRLDDLINTTTGSRRTVFKAFKKELRVPETKTYWDRIVADDRGYIWLRVPELEKVREALGGDLYRIINFEGEYIGDNRAPIGLGVPTRGQLLCLPTDEETGLIVPTVYRIQSAITGWKY
jgi:hypothetical protein